MSNQNSRYDALIADLRAKLCAEYEASPELQAEFVEAADYAAFTLNRPSAKPLLKRWKADYADADNMAALKAAEAAGRIKIMPDNVEAIEKEAAARRAAKASRFSSAH